MSCVFTVLCVHVSCVEPAVQNSLAFAKDVVFFSDLSSEEKQLKCLIRSGKHQNMHDKELACEYKTVV